MEEVGGGDDGTCWICGNSSSCNLRDTVTDSAASVEGEGIHNNNVHFVLKHVFELPSDLLDSYFKQSRNVHKNCVGFCKDCGDNYVEKCRKLFMEYLEVRRRFEGARREMIEVIRVKDENCKDKMGGNLPIVNEILQFVRHSDEPDEPNTSNLARGVDGDFLIKEEPASPSSSNFDDEMEVDKTPELIKCNSNDCFETFHTDTQLRDHQILVHKINYYVCPICKWKNVTQQRLDAHLKRYHVENTFEDNNMNTEPFTSQRGPVPKSTSVVMPTSNKIQNSKMKDVPKRKILNSDSTKKSQRRISIPTKTNIHSSNSTVTKVVTKYKLRVRKPVRYSTFDEADDFTDLREEDKDQVERKYDTGKLNCDKCFKTFKTKSLLQQHQKNSHKKSYYKCVQCGWKSVYISLYRFHMKSHRQQGNEKDSELEKVTCPFCKKIFANKSNLQAHISMLHNDNREKFKCDHCDKEYLDKAAYRSHLASEHQVKEFGRFPCGFKSCGKSFYHDCYLRDHEKTHSQGFWQCDTCEFKVRSSFTLRKHKEKEHPKPKPEKKPVDQGPFVCNLCLKQLSTKYGLNIHLRDVHNQPVGKPKKPRKPKDPTKFKCSECDSGFPKKRELKNHKEEIHGDDGKKLKKEKEPVNCHICGVILSCKSSLQHHIASIHERKFQVSCDLCEKTFVSRVNLRKHKQVVHNLGKDLNATCPVKGCGITLRKRLLKCHIQRVHEGQRKKQCDLCGLKLFGAHDLQKHMEAMHTNRESKPFICEECGKGFARKDYLHLHHKTHKRKQKLVLPV